MKPDDGRLGRANGGADFRSRPLVWAVAAFTALIALHLGVVSLVSGWAFTLRELTEYWHYIVSLAAGFALQVGLFARLRLLVAKAAGTRTVMATSGTTSAAALVTCATSCCTQSLAILAPILGATGLITFVSQYQVQFFWAGLAINAAAIAYLGRMLVTAGRPARCAVC